MEIKSPCIITPRLLPGAKIEKAFISIAYSGWSSGRRNYTVYLDTSDFEYTFSDLKSGVGSGTLQEGLVSALSFLAAAGESYGYGLRTGKPGENADLFPQYVAEWAYQNSNELTTLEQEIDETQDCILE